MPGKLGCMGGERGEVDSWGLGGGYKGSWVERREKGRIPDSLGNGMGGMEEGWIWEQGSKYLN